MISDNDIYKKITEQEAVNEKDAVMAYVILFNIKLINSSDVYLFCAALNLLNTFVKQHKKRISYSFKSRIHFLNVTLADNKIDNVSISLLSSKQGSVYLISVDDVQFSFHNIDLKHDEWNALKEYQAQLSWDGIRKQMCAKTALEIAYKNEAKTNLTKNDGNLTSYIEEQLERFDNNDVILGTKGPIDLSGNFV